MIEWLMWLVQDALWLIGRLSGGGSFPKPLSRAEERECVARMRAGDDEARRTLIEHNLRLVAHITRKYTVPGYTQDDLVSVGTLGLCKAVATFNPDTGAAISTYAAKCIENEVLMLLRASKKRRGDVSLSDPIGTDGEGNDITFSDILGTPPGQVEDDVVKKLSLKEVRRLVTLLPARERTVLEMRYGLLDGVARAQHEVAEKLNISRSYVSRMEKRAVEIIRAELLK